MISVVIPAYNHAHLIPHQLAAVLRQRPSVTKVIVVNDCSTDDTAEVLARLQASEPRLIALNLPKNVGANRALAAGFSLVETEFIAFASADDILLPNWIETAMAAFRMAPGAGLVLSPTFMINDAGEITKTVFPRSLAGKHLPPAEFLKSLMTYGTWFPSNTIVYRRDAFDASLFQFGSAGAFFDGLQITAIGLKFGVVAANPPLGIFYYRDSSMSGATIDPRVALAILKALASLLESEAAGMIDRGLASRLLRRNTYIYLVGTVADVLTKYAKFGINYLPGGVSRGLSVSLRLGLAVFKVGAFLSLRPFDLFHAGWTAKVVATPEEGRFLSRYRESLANPSAAVEKIDQYEVS